MAVIQGISSPTQRPDPSYSSMPRKYEKMEEASAKYPSNEIRLPFQSISNDQASRIVRHDYENASNYRYQNHDWRWVIADALFTGWKPTRYWESTKIPMSSLAVMVAFEQIESFIPRVDQILFDDPEWFDANPMHGTTPEAARKCRDIVLAQLHDSTPQWQYRQVAKSAAMYGNGVLMSGWEYSVNKLLQYIPEYKPVTKRMMHPVSGQMIQMPTGKYTRIIRENVIEETTNRPFIRYIPLRFCFPDPNAPSPRISDSRFFIHVSYMTVDELDALRHCDGFESMPDKYVLLLMAHQKPNDQFDTTLSEMEASRRASWTPVIDQSTDPAAARCKVVHYTTKDRIIWMINGQYLCYNKPNPIGRITYYNSFYADLLDRWYAMGIPDVIESEQRVQEGLVNGRLNELALALHPTTVRNRGSNTPIYQLRVRPGGVSDSNDPKNDIIRQYPTNATQTAYLETQASDLRAQKRTGITDLALLGVGTAQNPAARTATGAGLQGQAAHSRVQGFVGVIQLLVTQPMLEDVFMYDQRFLDPNQMVEALDGTELDPMVIWGAKVKFDLRATARMQAKQSLVQLMPMTMQAMMNPMLMEQLHTLNKTVNFVELFQMFMDATGFRKKFDWLRDLTPQEQQAMQAKQQMSPDIIKAQMQDKRMAALKDMQLSKDEMRIFQTVIDRLAEAHINKLYTSDDNADDSSDMTSFNPMNIIDTISGGMTLGR